MNFHYYIYRIVNLPIFFSVSDYRIETLANLRVIYPDYLKTKKKIPHSKIIMAGEDQLTLSDGGTVPDVMTIIPTNGSKLHQANGNGIKHNNINGSIIPNGRDLKIVTVDNGKLAAIAAADEKSTSFHTDFNDEETSCGWGPFKPRWLQRLATKQMFLVIFCITWVSFFNEISSLFLQCRA